MYYTDCNPNDPNLIWGIFVDKFYVGIVTLHSDFCLLIFLLFFEHACEVINEYDTAKLKIHTFRTVSIDHLHLQLL